MQSIETRLSALLSYFIVTSDSTHSILYKIPTKKKNSIAFYEDGL